MNYLDLFIDSYIGYWNYLVKEVTVPSSNSYFYGLIFLSLFVWGLEAAVPWRRKQALFRKDFWLDGFYMFFNFFLFSLIIYNGLSHVFVQLFDDFLALLGIENLVALHIDQWPAWTQFLFLFMLVDFIQWNVHRLLHRVPWLWEFHKVHHSVKEMGFAAHLRFHWMESIIYKSIQYIPVAMIGYSITEFFVVHMIAVLIGHLNHANINVDYGPLKYLFNNPRMHIWHHAKQLPKERATGVNFGISLSIWDYIFKTDYIPHTGEQIELGFDQDEQFPKSFWNQITYPFKKS